MKALQITSWKHSPELIEVDEPEARPGEVVVRIGGAGACHSDLHLLHEFDSGMLPFEPPFTLGHENAGWVHALGAGVTWLEIGQPVAVYGSWGCGSCKRCRQGIENYCERQTEIGVYGGGLGLDGGMARLMRVPSSRLLVPLERLAPVEAAPLTDAGLTPYHAIRRSLHLLPPGSTAVVVGVGGLGHLAVQMLRALTAATVVAIDPRDSARQLAKDGGADVTLAPGPDAIEHVRHATKGAGADVVVDLVGSDSTLQMAAAMSRPMGHVTLVGLAGGSVPFSFFSQPYEVSLATTYWGTLPELMEVIALAEAGRITPQIERFDLDEAALVYERLAAGEIAGRAVVVP
jgi:propanol-preferring alcohol dehydrogenase